MDTKLIRVDEKTHEIIRLESVRQSSEPNKIVYMRDVLAQYAEYLNKKYNLLKNQELK